MKNEYHSIFRQKKKKREVCWIFLCIKKEWVFIENNKRVWKNGSNKALYQKSGERGGRERECVCVCDPRRPLFHLIFKKHKTPNVNMSLN